MPGKGPPGKLEQVDFIVEWFKEYSDMQRDDFLKILVGKYSPESSDVCDGIEDMSVGDRPPSIFQCRMKLLGEWFTNWSDEEKEDLLVRLKAVDEKFMTRFEEVLGSPE